MNTRLSKVDTSVGVTDVVSSSFQDVDLTTSGPRTVSVVDGDHGDSGPEPVTGGELGLDFDLAVFDRSSVLGDQSCTLHRVDDLKLRRVGNGNTLGNVARGTGTVGGQVEGETVGDSIRSKVVLGECGHNVEDAVLDKRVVG